MTFVLVPESGAKPGWDWPQSAPQPPQADPPKPPPAGPAQQALMSTEGKSSLSKRMGLDND